MTSPLNATYATPRAGGRQRPATPPFDPPAGGDRTMIGQGAKGSDGTKVRTWVGILRFVIAPLERAAMPGTRSAQPIVASGLPTAPTGRIHDRPRPHANAAKNPLPNRGRPYMTIYSVVRGVRGISAR